MTVEALTATPEAGRANVLAALRAASAKTGSDFAYLLGTAMRESSLDSQAKSKASSATGLFQFIEQTWLGLVKRYGERHGLGVYAHAIEETGTGRYAVAHRDTKAAILALREDPELSALMAGEAANETKQSLECALGREVCGGELYAAHFLGAGAARQLLRLNEKNPDCCAADEFPQAARANRSVFFHPDGRAKTVREIYNWAIDLPEIPAAVTGSAAASEPQAAQLRGATQAALPSDRVALALAPKPSEAIHFGSEPGAAALRGIPMPARAASAPARGTAAPALPPRTPLLLSPGVVEILAALSPANLLFARRES